MTLLEPIRTLKSKDMASLGIGGEMGAQGRGKRQDTGTCLPRADAARHHEEKLVGEHKPLGATDVDCSYHFVVFPTSDQSDTQAEQGES